MNSYTLLCTGYMLVILLYENHKQKPTSKGKTRYFVCENVQKNTDRHYSVLWSYNCIYCTRRRSTETIKKIGTPKIQIYSSDFLTYVFCMFGTSDYFYCIVIIPFNRNYHIIIISQVLTHKYFI